MRTNLLEHYSKENDDSMSLFSIARNFVIFITLKLIAWLLPFNFKSHPDVAQETLELSPNAILRKLPHCSFFSDEFTAWRDEYLQQENIDEHASLEHSSKATDDSMSFLCFRTLSLTENHGDTEQECNLPWLLMLNGALEHFNVGVPFTSVCGPPFPGKAVRDSGIPREQVFVTTKLWNSDQGYQSTLRAFNRSLQELGLGYGISSSSSSAAATTYS